MENDLTIYQRILATLMIIMRTISLGFAMFCLGFFVVEVVKTIYFLINPEYGDPSVQLVFSLFGFWFFTWISYVADKFKEAIIDE